MKSINKILLTGSNGFIGSHIKTMINPDDLAIIHHRKNEVLHPRVFVRNIMDIKPGDNCFNGTETIIHCAGIVHSNLMNKSNEEIFNFNVTATLKFAYAASISGVKRFIFLSSTNVCGTNIQNNVLKFNSPAKPNDITGLTKLQTEIGLKSISNKTGLEIVIIRSPLVYGQGVKANFASMFKFVGKRIPLPFRSITNNRRSLVSVYNLIDLIKVCVYHPNAANQIFFVSDDKDISTSDMVALIAKVQGVNNYALPFPVWCFHLLGWLLNKQEVIDRLVGSLKVDISHTKETLDWKPPYSVEEGFAKCVENKKGKK